MILYIAIIIIGALVAGYYYLRYLWRHSESPLLLYTPTTYCVQCDATKNMSPAIVKQLIEHLPNASYQKKVGRGDIIQTHRYLWELVQTEPSRFPLFILEDHVSIRPKILDKLTRRIHIPNYVEWDVVILSKRRNSEENYKYYDSTTPFRLVRTDSSEFCTCRPSLSAYNTEGYLLSENGARKLIRDETESLVVYYLFPPLITP